MMPGCDRAVGASANKHSVESRHPNVTRQSQQSKLAARPLITPRTCTVQPRADTEAAATLLATYVRVPVHLQALVNQSILRTSLVTFFATMFFLNEV